MATAKNFEDLEIWKIARRLSNEIYDLTKSEAFAKGFSLKDQINRSAGSVMDNIAEGFERNGRKEFIQFLSFAKGSAGEVRSQLYRALDRKHIEQANSEKLINEVINLSKMISGLMKYLQQSIIKGSKYLEEPEVDYNIPYEN